MSLTTWKREFYPESAAKAAKRGALAATEHSLLKWRGLLPQALRRHGVGVRDGNLCGKSGARFFVDAETCALCEAYLDTACTGCPLYVTLGRSCAGLAGPEFSQWTWGGDPKPMIAALRATVRRLKKKGGRL